MINKLKGIQYSIYGIALSFPFILFCTILESYLKIRSISFENLIYTQSISPLLWLIDTSPIALGFFGWLIDLNQKKNRLITIKLEEANLTFKREVIKGKAIENHLRDMIDMYESDLKSAKLIQEFSLPDIPKMPEARIAYRYQPLFSIGGDFLSIIKLENGELSLLIGDVVGHGISAALITSLVRVLSNKTCRNFGTEPKKYLENLNEEVITYLPDDYYFTALYACLKFTKSGVSFRFSRGGHPYPFFYLQKQKQTKIGELVGIPLGLMAEAEYSELDVDLVARDRAYLITDGLLEVRNKEGKLLGVPGVIDIITEVNQQSLTLEESLDLILDQVKSYSDEKAFIDDTLILGIEIL